MERVELRERITRLKHIHLFAKSSFIIFEKMRQYRAPNLVGQEEAERRRDELGAYKGFVNITEASIETALYISVAKLYDSHRDALHLDRLIRYAESNQRRLTDIDTDDDQALSELYRGLSRYEWLEMKGWLDERQTQIRNLKIIRDKKVAHENVSVDDSIEYLTYEGIEDLIDLSGKILNLLSVKFLSTGMFDEPYFNEVSTDTDAVLKLISDSERARLRGITEEVE